MMNGGNTHQNGARSLAELTAGLLARAPADLQISDVTLDSRAVSPGTLFLACRGRSHHGIEFAPQAVARGAAAVLYDPAGVAPDALPQLSAQIFAAAVPELSQHVGTIADRFFGQPSAALTVAAVTGTNGKTTCAYLLAQALTVAGWPAAYIGTLGYGMPGALTACEHTTSDAVTVHRQLDLLRKAGAACIAMEVSSHALDQARVGGVRFQAAAFTNLTRDHLDYHGTMEAYGAAKARLFAWPRLSARVINIDDAFGVQLAVKPSDARLIVVTRRGAQLEALASTLTGFLFVLARAARAESSGLVIEVDSSWGTTELRVPLIGDFNIENVLTVCGMLLASGISLADAALALARCSAPSGRMETFGGGQMLPLAIVDYAHTPDALAKALRAARMHCRGKSRVVFGCGGDRDAGKRPAMGAIAAELADDIVLTDDNPRTEDPRRIIADILSGIQPGPSTPCRVEHDRATAIRLALNSAAPGDVVLIAGKGHEDYQITGRERRPFSDQAIVRQWLGEQA